MSQGYLYVATGSGYLEEAEVSARQLRRCDPDVPIHLYTDAATRDNAKDPEAFDVVTLLEAPQNNFHDKIAAMLASPFAKTIFVDTDTHQVNAFNLWSVLDRFDMAFAYDPIRTDFDQPDLPDAFPTPNTGLLAFRMTEAVGDVLRRWLVVYEEQLKANPPVKHDQPAFRRVLYESNLRFLVLPDEFNLRVIYPHLFAGNATVKMLHGRHENLQRSFAYAHTENFFPRVFGKVYGMREILALFGERMRFLLRLGPKQERRGVTYKG